MFPMMAEPIRILTVELEDGDGLVVTFSDRTTAGYVVEELLELRPHREPTERAAQALTLARSTELAGPEHGVDCK
jgi:hypothetical protein